MEKKILVPVTLQKDARLRDLDVDVELEVNFNLSHAVEAPPEPLSSEPVMPAWGLSGRPMASIAVAASGAALAPGAVPTSHGADASAETAETGDEQAAEVEERTMSFDTTTAAKAVKDVIGESGGKPGAAKPVLGSKPAPKAAGSKAAKSKSMPDPKGKPSSKTKIDNVLDELLKKKGKK